MISGVECLARINIMLQSLGGWLAEPMRWISFLGNGALYFLIVCIIYWSLEAKAGLQLGNLLFLCTALTSIIKLMLHSPRPYWCNTQVQVLATEVSFGFPSGHALTAATMWFALALVISRGWAWIPAVLMTLLIGMSRLYLGVHSLLDVTGGWLLGTVTVWAYWTSVKSTEQWWEQQNLGTRWRIVSFFSLALLLLAIAARVSLGSWTVPDDWIIDPSRTNPALPPISPARLSDGLVAVGALWGMGLGGAWISARKAYGAEGASHKRAARFAVGALGLVVVGLIAYLVLPIVPSWPLYVVQVALAAMGGLWVSALAPLVFVRLGLAQRESVV